MRSYFYCLFSSNVDVLGDWSAYQVRRYIYVFPTRSWQPRSRYEGNIQVRTATSACRTITYFLWGTSYPTFTHFRVHQFEKVEQFVICSPLDNESWKMFDEVRAFWHSRPLLGCCAPDHSMFPFSWAVVAFVDDRQCGGVLPIARDSISDCVHCVWRAQQRGSEEVSSWPCCSGFLFSVSFTTVHSRVVWYYLFIMEIHLWVLVSHSGLQAPADKQFTGVLCVVKFVSHSLLNSFRWDNISLRSDKDLKKILSQRILYLIFCRQHLDLLTTAYCSHLGTSMNMEYAAALFLNTDIPIIAAI